MQHSQVSPNARQQLAETVVLNKARLGLSRRTWPTAPVSP